MNGYAEKTEQDALRPAGPVRRLRLHISGAVQGVGFRPFVYRLATRLDLTGWVCNSAQGVVIEVEGCPGALSSFRKSVQAEAPPLAHITCCRHAHLDASGYPEFVVRESSVAGAPSAIVLPDVATCPDCVREIFDPGDRRFRYPFANCTNCGPRYSIIEALPYDRKHTSMKIFPMCRACREEYENPADRRFHAQPNACPECGPHLELWDRRGTVVSERAKALAAACDYVRDGKILALKGLGGFQLIVDARNESAVRRLRDRKLREEKPLALMYPGVESILDACEMTKREFETVTSHRAPIVLLRRREQVDGDDIAPSVARRSPFLGIMLPYTPLHHLMMAELGFPVVATSGNLPDEPICIDEREALTRLNAIADIFLVHNRPIVRQIDDSVVRVIACDEQVIRCARGYAPLPLKLPAPVEPMTAVGGHLKNTTAAASGEKAFLSQHIGDLDTAPAYDALDAVASSLMNLYDIRPSLIVHDNHPDYASSRYAAESGMPRASVQHHHAHILSCMLDNEIDGPALGVAWDGTGLGADGTIWGGEFLVVDERGYSRAAHMRRFRLPGGEAAIREPRRAAMGMLYEIYGDDLLLKTGIAPINAFSKSEIGILLQLLSGGINSPVTSSCGRMFDAAASLLDTCQVNEYEGQAAMTIGYLAEKSATDEMYPYGVDDSDGPLSIDWRATLISLLDDISRTTSKATVAGRFHNTLCDMIVNIARRVGEKRIVLSGGCFQNRYLSERVINRLRRAGFKPFWHHRIPPNDGGIAAGQIAAQARRQKGGR